MRPGGPCGRPSCCQRWEHDSPKLCQSVGAAGPDDLAAPVDPGLVLLKPRHAQDQERLRAVEVFELDSEVNVDPRYFYHRTVGQSDGDQPIAFAASQRIGILAAIACDSLAARKVL
ncbi:hypothetical protein PF003_g31540 [Phytophthora fragariae]|nr:hypothetical protein PF003_g31540 [Phytophthora fragariae]